MISKTRKAVALGSAAAVVAGGALVASQLSSSAAAQLVYSPSSTSLTALNWAAAGTSTTLPARVADATTCVRVADSRSIKKLRLDYLSYTEHEDVDPSGLPNHARLLYRQVQSNSAAVPASGWRALDLPVAGTPAPINTGSVLRTGGRNVCVAAVTPGEYKLRFVDPGEEAGTDDDVVGQTITLTIKDAYAKTQAALVDDWKPGVTGSPSAIAVGGSAVGTVNTGLTKVDARGSSSGVGVLAEKTAILLGLRFSSTDPGDALDQDLGRNQLGQTPKFTAAKTVTVTGSRDLPAKAHGYKVIRHTGEFRVVASLDRNGNGAWGITEDLTRTTGNSTVQVLDKLPTPQAVVSELIVRPKGKGNVWVHIAGTRGTWKIYRNGGLIRSGTGSYIGWAVTGVPKGAQTFTARVTAPGYSPAEQTVTVTVS